MGICKPITSPMGTGFWVRKTPSLSMRRSTSPSWKKHHVIADRDKRKVLISERMSALAEEAALLLRPDEGLLEEVTGLVEWPVALLGHFDEAYLDLPPEVLILEMRYHQKYFALYNTCPPP